MASETVWVPQTPKARAPAYHTRSSSIGWRNNFPFHRKRADSNADQAIDGAAKEKKDCPISSSAHGLRKKGSRAFKRSNTSNDATLAAAARVNQCQEGSLTRSCTTAQVPDIPLPPGREQKLDLPEELKKELDKLAGIRKSKSFDDLGLRDAGPAWLSQAAERGRFENPRDAPALRAPTGRSLALSPGPRGRLDMRRTPSISPRPANSGNAWQQEALTKKRSTKETSSGFSIGQSNLLTPPESVASVSPTSKDVKIGHLSPEQIIDGVEFEMLAPPIQKHKGSSRQQATAVREQAAASQPSQHLELPAPGLPGKSASPSPTISISPEMTAMFSFPLPPPPQVPNSPSPRTRRHRWTVSSSTRASSVLLPDAYEQPATPARRAHKRASSENDTEMVEIECRDGTILIPSRPPTPPPKMPGLPANPAQDAEHRKSIKVDTSNKPSRLSIPPVCPRGTLPTPRSKFNPHFAPQPKPLVESPVPPMPVSAGARIAAAAAAKATPSANLSRSVSLKMKPPSRSPPPVPSASSVIKARTSPPTRNVSRSRALKRRSSDSDKGGRQLTDRVKKSTNGGIERTKSQVRRELVKKMALDNIGAPKVRDLTKTAYQPKRLEQPSETRHALETKPSLRRLETPYQQAFDEKADSGEEILPAQKSKPEKPSVVTGDLLKIQANEVERIGSLSAELKRLEDQCAQARRHQEALHEARKRLQSIPDSPISSVSSGSVSDSGSSSNASSTQTSGSSPRELVLAQLDSKIEKWRKEVRQVEHRRNRIRKKLAWHSADRLKLVHPKPRNPPDAPLPHRPVSMFSPSSTLDPEHALTVALPPLPSIDTIVRLNAEPNSTAVYDQPMAGIIDAERLNASPAPSLASSMEAGPSVDDTITSATHPSTPDRASPPLTAANQPWLGLENPYLTPTAVKPSANIETIMTPTTVGAGPGRHTIQLFADEDIIADVAKTAEGLPISPTPRYDRQMTIQIFADSGITDLVTALQDEIESMGKEDHWRR